MNKHLTAIYLAKGLGELFEGKKTMINQSRFTAYLSVNFSKKSPFNLLV